MVKLWSPDICPVRPTCTFETANGQQELVRAVRLCSHHQAMASGGLTHDQIRSAALQTCRAKEAARWAIKQELMARLLVDKEYPGVSWATDADGTIRIETGRTGTLRTTLRTLAAAAVATVQVVPGMAAVAVD
ncbi:MAG: hypothetical protein ACREEP_14130 [Dongiaceae bacterium]